MNDSANDKSDKAARSDLNRRRYERQRIRLDARVTGKSGKTYSYEIHDYCAGGMLLSRRGKARGNEAPLKRGELVELLTKVLTPKGRVRVRVEARINWVHGDSVGARFLRPSRRLVNALIEHKRLLRGTNRLIEGLDREQRHALRAMEPTVVATFRGIFYGVLCSLSRELAATAVKPTTAETRSQLFQDMSAVKASTTEWPDRLARRLFADATGSPKPAVRPGVEIQDIKPAELQEFARWLESAKTATELETQFSEILTQFGQALSRKAAAPNKVAVIDVPFNPRQIVDVLLGYAKKMSLDSASCRILYTVAEQELSRGLQFAYETLLAKLQGKSLEGAGPTGNRSDNATSNDACRTGAAQDEPPVSVYADEPTLVRATAVAAHAELGERQAQRRLACAQELVGYLGQCATQVGSDAPQWLVRIDELLLASLNADSRALQRTENPLCKIVDGLDHLQLFLSEDSQAPNALAAARRVESWLSAIATAAVDSPGLRQTAAEISEFVRQVSERYQRQAEWVVAAHEHRQRLVRAQADVADILNHRYAGKRVPEVLVDLLAVGWRAILEHALLVDGEAGQTFRDRIGVLDAVFELIGEETQGLERDAQAIAELLVEIRNQLASAALDRLQRTTVERRLRLELAARDDHGIRRIEFPECPVEDGLAAFARPEGIKSKDWRVALSKVDEFEVGDVLRRKTRETLGDLWRIAWRDDDHAQFSLVDGNGAHLADMSAAQLAELWHKGQLLHVPEACRPLSMRALHAMLERMQQQLRHQANRQSPTGLPNRVRFQAKLENLCGANKRASGPKVLLWIDLDHFRLINEIHGYGTGDSYLVSLARLLEGVFGDAVVIGHIGGDRFAVLLPRTRVEDAFDEARSACREIAKISKEWGSRSLRITASIGVVALDDLDASVEHLLQAGEAAARTAKAEGGNQAKRLRATAAIARPRRRSIDWEAQIDEAMQRGRLQLRCQPITPLIVLPERKPYYEVLLGIQNAAGEALPIGEFISAAEHGQRMAAVDRWVTRTVIEWIQANRERMGELGGFAINLSAQTLIDPEYPAFLDELLDSYSIPPQWLSFELAENAVIGHSEAALSMVEGLRAAGCRVALDDVGSSATCYAYLNELSVDAIKIDGVFVRNIGTNEDDLTVVQSINEIGHFLGKQTIAEYAIDRTVLRQLTEVGVDFAQGFAISPPVRMAELAS